MRKKAHGTGLSGRATHDVLDLAFNALGLHRVYLNVRTDNVRARRFYEKSGFSHEGTFREAIKTATGYCDLEWYSMLISEFS